jgi:hypothetical protein
MFRLGLEELVDVWSIFLTPSTIGLLKQVSQASEDAFHLPDELWAEIIYRFAIGAHKQVLHREHLLKSLTSLYLGRVASFVLQTREASEEEAEEMIEGLCREFEREKPLLVKAW